VSWAIHFHLIKGFCLGFEIVDETEGIWFIVVDVFILRIGIEIEKAN